MTPMFTMSELPSYPLAALACVADHARRDARDDGEVGNTLGHDRPRPHHRALADREPGENGRVGADRGGALDERRLDLPVRLSLKAAVGIRRPRATVVREHHPVTDEHLVLDDDALANERV